MDFALTNDGLDKLETGCLMLAVFDAGELSAPAATIDKIAQGYISEIIERGDMQGKLGSTLLLHDIPHLTPKRVLLVGCGKRDKFSLFHLKKAQTAAYQALKEIRCASCVDAFSGFETINQTGISQQLQQSILAAQTSVYYFDACKSKKNTDGVALQSVTLALPENIKCEPYQAIIKQSGSIGIGMALCKELANLPANVCTPTYLAEQAKLISKKYANMKYHVMEEKEMQKKGMGALLSVSAGSEQPAKLITLEYHGGDKQAAPIALVGKGVTFDTGGISLKPPATMDEMKYDMCGAASVLGTLTALAEMEAPINVIGIIPATENMPNGRATKPGDIVTTMSGQTVEVLNTDAEGRLILCDALTYARTFNPKTVIDIATLTGAMVVALGNDVTGMFTADDTLANDLLTASEQTTDHAWRLPIWEPYQEKIDSPFADIANIGDRAGGSITAACFLARFTEGLSWAHLDIAGTAWTSGKNKGASGRPVPLLTQYCLNTLDDDTTN